MIRVEGLRKRYTPDGPEAVAGVDFTVARGEIFGLLGPNGAGKTTTIGTMTTRVKPTAGRVLVDGIDVSPDPVAVKQRDRRRPPAEQPRPVADGAREPHLPRRLLRLARRERRKRALELLDLFGLGGRESDKVNRYSGGMAQRLMIARALMHQPRLLVLDEPTTGLDPQSRLFLWERIVELRARGTTLLLTTHDMLEADRLCDRIAIMDHGQVIANDTPPRPAPAAAGRVNGLELLLDRREPTRVAVFERRPASSEQLDRRGRRPLAGPPLRRRPSACPTRPWRRPAGRRGRGRASPRCGRDRGHPRGRLRPPRPAGISDEARRDGPPAMGRCAGSRPPRTSPIEARPDGRSDEARRPGPGLLSRSASATCG